MSDSEFEGAKEEVAGDTKEGNWMGQPSLSNINAQYSGAQALPPPVRAHRIQQENLTRTILILMTTPIH